MRRTFKSLCFVLCMIMCIAIMSSCGSEEEKALDEAVTNANELIELDEKAYDPQTKETLADLVEKSKDAKETEDIVEYTESINTAAKEYSDSVKQLKQVTAPEEAFVIERLKTVEGISDIEAATEETDGNNLLNKEGSYTSYVAYRSPDVDYFDPSASTIERGNDGGGCVETFRTVKDAETRNEYLSNFDGSGILSPGTHTVVGTLVVRTSSELTATQGKELEKKIIDALIKLDEK